MAMDMFVGWRRGLGRKHAVYCSLHDQWKAVVVVFLAAFPLLNRTAEEGEEYRQMLGVAVTRSRGFYGRLDMLQPE